MTRPMKSSDTVLVACKYSYWTRMEHPTAAVVVSEVKPTRQVVASQAHRGTSSSAYCGSEGNATVRIAACVPALSLSGKCRATSTCVIFSNDTGSAGSLSWVFESPWLE